MKIIKIAAIGFIALILSAPYANSATVSKSLIGAQDIHQADGTTTRTFTRPSSTGGTITLNDVGYEVDALIAYGGGVNYTQATIQSALTAIGTVNKVTLLLRPGTWVISSNANWSAYTNVTFKIVPGAVISHGAFTVNIPNPAAGLYQWLIGAGVVTISGNTLEVYPEWWGAVGNNATNDHVAIQAAINSLAVGGTVRFRPTGKYGIGATVSINSTYPISLVSDMVQPEGQKGGYFYPSAVLPGGMFDYLGGGNGTVRGLAFYDRGGDGRNYAILAALKLTNYGKSTIQNCMFEYLKGSAIVTLDTVMVNLNNLIIRLCGDTDIPALKIGTVGTVSQSITILNLISEVNYSAPYIRILSQAADTKILGARFEADTSVGATSQRFIENFSATTMVYDSHFLRNDATAFYSSTSVSIANSYFNSDPNDGNPALLLVGQGARLSNLILNGGTKQTGYDIVLGTSGSGGAYASLSNIVMSYSGGILDYGNSILSNINMGFVYSIPAPTGKYNISLGVDAVSYASNILISNIPVGNYTLLSNQVTNKITNVTGYDKTSYGTIANPATTVVITHGLSFTPDVRNISLTPDWNTTAWITTIGATQFTINVGTSPAVVGNVGWIARY